MQASLTQFFFRAEWLFITVLSAQLNRIVLGKSLHLTLKQTHASIWLISLLLELLPLTSGAFYGADDGKEGMYICGLWGPNRRLADVWYVISFFMPLVVCLLSLFFFSFRTFLWYRSEKSWANYSPIKLVVDVMMLYPAGNKIPTYFSKREF